MTPSSHAHDPFCPGCGREFSLADLATMARGDGAEKWLWAILPNGEARVVPFSEYDPATMRPAEREERDPNSVFDAPAN